MRVSLILQLCWLEPGVCLGFLCCWLMCLIFGAVLLCQWKESRFYVYVGGGNVFT